MKAADPFSETQAMTGRRVLQQKFSLWFRQHCGYNRRPATALTHSDRSYLLSKFCFQERAPTTDECDGSGLTVASCSTSHSCTIKNKSHGTFTSWLFDWIWRFVTHTVRATVSSQRHTCILYT